MPARTRFRGDASGMADDPFPPQRGRERWLIPPTTCQLPQVMSSLLYCRDEHRMVTFGYIAAIHEISFGVEWPVREVLRSTCDVLLR